MVINGGTFIVNETYAFTITCHYFELTVNNGTFKTNHHLMQTSDTYSYTLSFKRLTFEAIDKDNRDAIQLGVSTSQEDECRDWIAEGSKLYYVSATDKAIERSGAVQGQQYPADGYILITDEPVQTYLSVQFHDDVVSANNTQQYLISGEKVTRPEIATTEGRTFIGWYTDPEYNDPFDFDTIITEDYDLYAKWEYTATGNLGNPQSFGIKSVGYDPISAVSVPIILTSDTVVDPARLHAELTGLNPEAFDFYLNTSAGMMQGSSSDTGISYNSYDLFHVAPVTGLEAGLYSASLVLKYDQDNDGIYEVTIGTKSLLFSVREKITVTFNTNGGTTIDPIQFGIDEQLIMPPNPTKAGYIFDGWYLDPELSSSVDPSQGILENITFYAKWKRNISWATVTGMESKTYNGYYQKQKKLVITIDGKTLVEGIDYTLKHKNNKNAGTATVTITGIGDYAGSLSKTFKIAKAKNSLTITSSNKTVSYTKLKKAAQVVKPIYYQKKNGTLTYSKLDGSSARLLLNKTTGKVTVKKGTAKGKYKIRIKVLAAGDANHLSKYIIRTIYITVK